MQEPSKLNSDAQELHQPTLGADIPLGEDRFWLERLDYFRDHMQTLILRNRHKGMREAWVLQPLLEQIKSLRISIRELEIALEEDVDVMDKAADVANWALIIWDHWDDLAIHKSFGLDPSLRGNK